jgi:hypothetical protein
MAAWRVIGRYGHSLGADDAPLRRKHLDCCGITEQAHLLLVRQNGFDPSAGIVNNIL